MLKMSRFIRQCVLILLLTHQNSTQIINHKMPAGDSTTYQIPGTKQQRIIIENKWGDKLVGLLHETGSNQIVIVCHGAFRTKEDSLMVDLCIALERQGISAFRFDFSGNGESEGSPHSGDLLKEVDDIKSVIQHFTAASRVVTAIIGHSKGGSEVILYASLHQDIKTIVSMSARYDLNRPFEGKDYWERPKKELLFGDMEDLPAMQFLRLNLYEAALRIGEDCKVLIVHGSVDQFTPAEEAVEFAKIISNHELRIIEGANHDYINHRGELVSVVLDFIKDSMHWA